jgi:molybdopterin molybdotransferase
MRGFARRTTVEDALKWLDGQVAPLAEETVPLAEAAGRVLSRQVQSGVDVPPFARAMMDGFALHAADTLGASPYNRLALALVGESLPGRPFTGHVVRGQAVRIMTGAPMPDGADAVLPAEVVEAQPGQILAQGEVSPGKHVGQVGEDIAAGSVVLPRGRVLRPQDVGLLASVGLGEVPVVRRPRVRIVVTGNELLPAGAPPQPYKIFDSNGPMLSALVARDGGITINPGIVADQPEAILAAMQEDADVILVSGGSSVGQEDHVPRLVAQHGKLPIHGIAMRPSSPAGLGRLGPRLVFLLPGNPVSCLCAYDFFAGRAIRALGGRPTDWPYRRLRVALGRKIVSTVGRLDYVRVRLVEGRAEPLGIGGASVLSSTTRADGFVLVPPDSEGYPPGAEVEMFLYDR